MTRIISATLGLLILSLVSATNEALAADCPPGFTRPADPLGGGSSPTTKIATFSTGSNFILCDGDSNVSAWVYDLSVSLNKDGTFLVHYDYYNGSGTKKGSQKLIVLALDQNNNTITQISDDETPRESCHYVSRIPVSRTGTFNPSFFDFIKSVKLSLPRVSPFQEKC